MTTPIAPGDLVLRNGRAEEVESLRLNGMEYVAKDQSTYTVRDLAMATRIGAVSDGWRVHDGDVMPLDLSENDYCEVWTITGGLQPARPAAAWNWSQETRWRIVAYRVVSRAERPDVKELGTLKAGDKIIMGEDGVPTVVSPDRTADRRAVAAELRAKADHASRRETFTGQAFAMVDVNVLKAWANAIDPPAPEPLKVGDRVRRLPNGQDTGDVFGVHGSTVAVAWRAGSKVICAMNELERIS